MEVYTEVQASLTKTILKMLETKPANEKIYMFFSFFWTGAWQAVTVLVSCSHRVDSMALCHLNVLVLPATKFTHLAFAWAKKK